jgi:hypothetical protein
VLVLLPRNGLARLGERLTRRGGVRQVLEQLTGVLLAHALQGLGELSRNDGSQPFPALGEVHHMPPRGIPSGTGHPRRPVSWQAGPGKFPPPG